MTLVLLLVLAGSLEAARSHGGASSEGLDAQGAMATRTDRPEPASLVAPRQSGGSGPGALLAFPSVPAKVRKPKGPDRGVTQLRNERTGVTCTLLILRVDPPVDAKMVTDAPGTTADTMTRNDLSPCVE